MDPRIAVFDAERKPGLFGVAGPRGFAAQGAMQHALHRGLDLARQLLAVRSRIIGQWLAERDFHIERRALQDAYEAGQQLSVTDPDTSLVRLATLIGRPPRFV